MTEFVPIENPGLYLLQTVWYASSYELVKSFEFYRDQRPDQYLHAMRLAGVIFRFREMMHDEAPKRLWLSKHPHAIRMADLEDEYYK